MSFNNILVVCVGNICRSPIAAALLMHHYPEKHIDSAGLSAVVGHPADSKAMAVMSASHSIDDMYMSDHIAKQINEQLVGKADLILTMSTSQSKWIEEQWPHCRGKIFRIGHWIDKDVADPYGHSETAFETAKQDIVDSLDQWFNKI
ncbi:low molecular weight phosphotyrosine protein phosphatase [Psychrobacter frigidicola]|uniref:protein-tyrosine-phosphatase n=1 Tax=Psychrobacter frigidicola TaxID=45611 RepID=A0A5C7A392_9GAMM|nr:low molecular weight protein-tyrosine-phosphatase [Psychrobacter frigidicola]TXD98087.1 low molecular weight phosphotyrosine protein phosphatase [Psychrobacter frigidicola]